MLPCQEAEEKPIEAAATAYALPFSKPWQQDGRRRRLKKAALLNSRRRPRTGGRALWAPQSPSPPPPAPSTPEQKVNSAGARPFSSSLSVRTPDLQACTTEALEGSELIRKDQRPRLKFADWEDGFSAVRAAAPPPTDARSGSANPPTTLSLGVRASSPVPHLVRRDYCSRPAEGTSGAPLSRCLWADTSPERNAARRRSFS